MECKPFWYEVVVDPPPSLHVGGELDLDSSASLRRALDDVLDVFDAGAGDRLAIDLSEVTFLGVSAFRVIEDLVRERQVTVELCELSRPARRLFAVLDVPHVLTPVLVATRGSGG